jgi:hypothetical protein
VPTALAIAETTTRRATQAMNVIRRCAIVHAAIRATMPVLGFVEAWAVMGFDPSKLSLLKDRETDADARPGSAIRGVRQSARVARTGRIRRDFE